MSEENNNDDTYVSKVLDEIRQQRERGGWPICVYVADPPGNELVQTYVAQQHIEQRILSLEIPSLAEQKRREMYLPTLFLSALDKDLAAKRDDAESKRMLLKLLIMQKEIDLIVLTNVHHLVTPKQHHPLTYEITWIKAFIKELHPPVPVVLSGNLELVERIIHSNQQMKSLFSRLLLPSEQKGLSVSQEES